MPKAISRHMTPIPRTRLSCLIESPLINRTMPERIGQVIQQAQEITGLRNSRGGSVSSTFFDLFFELGKNAFETVPPKIGETELT